MEKRYIYTKVWEDDWFANLSRAAKLLFLWSFSNGKIGYSGYFAATDRVICFHTGLTATELEEAKKEISSKVMFHGDWVYVKNAEKHEPIKGDNNPLWKAYQKEVDHVPEEIKQYFKAPTETLARGYEAPPKGHLGTGTGKGFKKQGDARGIPDEAASNSALEVLKRHNENYGTNFTSARSIQSNLKYWLEAYRLEQILEADDNIQHHEFWRGKMTPDILLRRKNTKGEDVDYIGQLLNTAKTREKAPVRLGYKAMMEREHGSN